jgi:uncharacterized protein YecT (DUF1311 family)
MRYSLLAGAFTLVFILSASSAIAQEEEPDCKKPQGHLEIITCVGRSERESAQEMQATYQKLQQQYQSQTKLPKEYRQKRLNYLIKSQQAWLEYRSAQCQWIASEFEGGSMQPIAGISCQMDLNRQRIVDLSKDLSD